MRRPEPTPELRPAARDSKRERLRLRALIGTATVLFAICVAVSVSVLSETAAMDPELPASELPGKLVPIRAVAVGPMLCTQVSGWVWEDLTASERLQRVEELGASARERGFDTLYVTDENGKDLATWSVSDGASLVDSEA